MSGSSKSRITETGGAGDHRDDSTARPRSRPGRPRDRPVPLPGAGASQEDHGDGGPVARDREIGAIHPSSRLAMTSAVSAGLAAYRTAAAAERAGRASSRLLREQAPATALERPPSRPAVGEHEHATRLVEARGFEPGGTPSRWRGDPRSHDRHPMARSRGQILCPGRRSRRSTPSAERRRRGSRRAPGWRADPRRDLRSCPIAKAYRRPGQGREDGVRRGVIPGCVSRDGLDVIGRIGSGGSSRSNRTSSPVMTQV